MADGTDTESPLWAKVLADLRLRLDAGEFTERFPADSELVDHYKVSRHTAREAVRRLQGEGLLERRRGQGSFVVAPRLAAPRTAVYSLFQSIEETGTTQQSVVRVLEERRDDKAEAMLGCFGQPLVYVERLRLADEVPIALDCAWMPASMAHPLLEVDFRHVSLYEQLAERCDVRSTSGWERIRPGLANPLQRDLLCIDERQPVFTIERLGLQGDQPVEWRHGVVRGDRYSFVARWASDQLSTTFERTTGSA